jgi:hypothetical protein
MRPACAGRIPEGSSLRSDETTISHADDEWTPPRSRWPGLHVVRARRRVERLLDDELGLGSPYPNVHELYVAPVEVAYRTMAASA